MFFNLIKLRKKKTQIREFKKKSNKNIKLTDYPVMVYAIIKSKLKHFFIRFNKNAIAILFFSWKYGMQKVKSSVISKQTTPSMHR